MDPVIKDEAKRARTHRGATDLVKDKFGESAVRFGRESCEARGNTTGSASKNPADYKEAFSKRSRTQAIMQPRTLRESRPEEVGGACRAQFRTNRSVLWTLRASSRTV